jgi:hypothetical protein
MEKEIYLKALANYDLFGRAVVELMANSEYTQIVVEMDIPACNPSMDYRYDSYFMVRYNVFDKTFTISSEHENVYPGFEKFFKDVEGEAKRGALYDKMLDVLTDERVKKIYVDSL